MNIKKKQLFNYYPTYKNIILINQNFSSITKYINFKLKLRDKEKQYKKKDISENYTRKQN